MSLAVNKGAGFHYELLENFEAGLALNGSEVKAAKLGQVSLKGSHVSWRQLGGARRLCLIGAHFTPYKFSSLEIEPTRERPLLLKKNELNYLIGKTQEKGLTLIPLRLYTKNNFVKLELALARGKKLYDKREAIKKRDVDREIKRTLKTK